MTYLPLLLLFAGDQIYLGGKKESLPLPSHTLSQICSGNLLYVHCTNFKVHYTEPVPEWVVYGIRPLC